MRFISILAVALWLILGYLLYDSSCECCNLSSAAAAAPLPVKKVVDGPILFDYAKGTPITGTGWTTKKQELIDGLKENYKLEIVGYYGSDEVNNTSEANLGIARAKETAQLFTPPLDMDQIKTYGRLRDSKIDKDNRFESVDFRYKMFTKNIKELADRTLIYFPFNSTQKLNDTAVENYLDDVAKKIMASGERVELTGHTDNVGEEANNEALGLRRANVVASYLMSQGVTKDKIIALSKGETSPVASNDTDEGRAQNRRTELRIIK